MELMESSMAKLVDLVDLYWYNLQSKLVAIKQMHL